MPNYVIRKKVYYDTITQCYKNILTINQKPAGNLLPYVKSLRPTPVSPFQRDAEFSQCYSTSCTQSLCVLGIVTHPHGNNLYCAENIGDFFVFLIELGYSIDTALTKLARQSNDPSIIAIISS